MQSRWDINFFNMTRKEKILLILYEHSSGIDGNSDEVTSKDGLGAPPKETTLMQSRCGIMIL